MRSLFYSLSTLLLLTTFFYIASLLSSQDYLLSDQESTLVQMERVDSLFENVGEDLTDILGYDCGTDQQTTNVSILLPGDPTPPQDRLTGYETFIENNYPGAQLDLSGLLNDIGNGNNYIIIIDGREIRINYNVPKVSFDLVDGTNITLEFPGYIDRIEWQPLHSGPTPFCIIAQTITDCQSLGGASNADVYVNDTNHTPAGRLQVHVSGNLGVQVFANLVDNNLIPWVNITLGFPGSGNPLYLNGADLTYTLQNVNRTDGIVICQ